MSLVEFEDFGVLKETYFKEKPEEVASLVPPLPATLEKEQGKIQGANHQAPPYPLCIFISMAVSEQTHFTLK